jgi:hypothetical protein
MAEQVSSGTVAGAPGPGSPTRPAADETNHGRAVSWVAVSIIMVAFIAGGLALVLGPIWWLFWASLGLAAAGGLLGLGTNILDDWY